MEEKNSIPMRYADKKRIASKSKKLPSILIVEDELIIAHDLKFCLEQMGCKVVGIVTSGEESIKAILIHHPDVVLMDIKLKGKMSGIEAAEIISQRWQIPIIYLSAYSELSLLQKIKKTNYCGYLSKPIALTELKDSLENALHIEI
ncbi:MAG: hypothetical protein B5M54_05480 [Candidatus Aminicenantes bacterium 4484_214]|nr:MAG: hypothetical protein B5M54_05480 [Candidatus Aminicenantes bacterium 4484_214]RLE07611.1 MAG: response regulator [Candidatus Aminicenantes bacterium]